MNTRSILFLLIALSIIPASLHSQVLFSEVMYDLEGTDTGREWIEVYNSGQSAVDLSAWKLYEADTNHKITAVGDALISSGTYAIIADVPDKFRVDYPGFTGLLFDSVFSLNNEGETIVLRDENGADVDTLAYVSALGGQNGDSLHKQSDGWVGAAPSPGDGSVVGRSSATIPTVETVTDTSASEIPSIGSGTNGYSSHSNQVEATVSPHEPVFVVSSGRQRLGYTGVPLTFEAKIKSIKASSLGNTLHHHWSFGDGFSMTGEFVSHVYVYPGDYIVILNSDGGAESAVSKTKVRIVDPEVEVSQANSDYIEIYNKAKLEVNVGGWILESGYDRMFIPQDTIIEPLSRIKIPIPGTRLRTVQESVRLAVPSGIIVSTFDLSDMVASNEIDMPLGITAETIKEKFQIAMEIEAYKRSLVQETKIPVFKDEALPITSERDTMVASVILSVPEESEEDSWWERLISAFKK